jgi:two-component system, chemotaxis family, response regulator Rcp1
MSSTAKILLAEDNPADVYLIEEALREHQVVFEITVAEDGEAAMAMIASGQVKPDLILLDLNMPKRSGGEVLTHLREQLHCKTTPVIVLTSSDSPADREEALRLGATSYIRKPTGLDEFLEIGAAIKQLLAAKT